MKAESIVKKIQPNGRLSQRAAQLLALLFVVFCLTISSILVSADDSLANDTNERLCTKTAKAVRSACEAGAAEALGIAIGKCNNLASASEREACKQQAQQDQRDTIQECAEQFNARRDICKMLGEAAYNPTINPANFVEGVTNPFFPLVPGTSYIYRNDEEIVTVTVTNRTKVISGVKCVVVRDTVTTPNGQVVEDTEDFYAQDIQGNVWYFSEITQEFDNGDLVSLEGSFKTGVDGAKPGIIMPANPQVGDVYRQEFLLNEAEDLAQVLSITGSATVPMASCKGDCLVTKEFTPISPGAIENKYYARGIGFILEINPDSGKRLELVEIRK